MMRFRMIDGAIYEGKTFAAIVRAMASNKLRRATSLARYRHNTAERVKEAYDITIDASRNDQFIWSLCKAGLMEQLQ